MSAFSGSVSGDTGLRFTETEREELCSIVDIEGVWYVRTGILGERRGRLERNLGTWAIGDFSELEVRRGDLSWPPKGPSDFSSSVGSLIDPKGDTFWTFSHEPNDGGLGGFLGSQSTLVVLTIEFRRGSSPAPDLGNNENETWEPVFLAPPYADCDAAIVVPT